MLLRVLLQQCFFSVVIATLQDSKKLESFILNIHQICVFHCINPSNIGTRLIEGVILSKSSNPKLIQHIKTSGNVTKAKKSSWRTKSTCTVAILDIAVSQSSSHALDRLLKTLLTNRSPPQALLIHAYLSRTTIKVLFEYKFSAYVLPGSIVTLILDKPTGKYNASLVYHRQRKRGLFNKFLPIELNQADSQNSLAYLSHFWWGAYRNLNLITIFSNSLQKKELQLLKDETNCYKRLICTHAVLSVHYNYTVAQSYHFVAAKAKTTVLLREYWHRHEPTFGTKSATHRNIWITSHVHDDNFAFQTYTKREEVPYIAILQPYSKKVWVLLGATVVIFCGIMNVCSRHKIGNPKIIFWTFSSFMEQFSEYGDFPKETSWGSQRFNKIHIIRFLAISWVFIVLYLNNLYKGDLYSLMVSEKEPTEIPTSLLALFESNVTKISFESITYNGKTRSLFRSILVYDLLSLYSNTSRIYRAINNSKDSVLFRTPVNKVSFAANLSHGLEINMSSGTVLRSPLIIAVIGQDNHYLPLLTQSILIFNKYQPNPISQDDAHVYKVYKPWLVDANFFGGIFKRGFTQLVESGLEGWWHSKQRKHDLGHLLGMELKKARMQMSNVFGRIYSEVDEGLKVEGSPVGVGKLGVTLAICGISWALAWLSFGWEVRKELSLMWGRFRLNAVGCIVSYIYSFTRRRTIEDRRLDG